MSRVGSAENRDLGSDCEDRLGVPLVIYMVLAVSGRAMQVSSLSRPGSKLVPATGPLQHIRVGIMQHLPSNSNVTEAPKVVLGKDAFRPGAPQTQLRWRWPP